MSDFEATQGTRRSTELSALPKLIVPPTTQSTNATSNGKPVNHPHALSVDFQFVKGKGEAVSPCSDISPTSRCSVVSLSPSLFPLPPTGATPPTTAHSTCFDSPPGTSRSHTSFSSWFSPPSPPPSSPLPPTPCQKKLASIIATSNGLETLQVPPSAKVKSPLAETPESSVENLVDSPGTPLRRLTNYTIDNRGFRESVIDPDAPRLSLPPPYSPGLCAPGRLSSASASSSHLDSSRVDSTTPLAFRLADYGSNPHSPAAEPQGRSKRGDLEAGCTTWRPWQTEPKRRKRKMWVAVVGAAAAALLMALAGVAVGIYLAVAGTSSI
ncbi:hypothetical protein GGS26DRAFT_422737 [Hypomontagnella submonticulosa]|nr:hypothetical protein GGS26DRAFT_422737 [Hypomontagnella submonticulosa]